MIAAHTRPTTSIAATVVAWTAIAFAFPITLVAFYLLVPNIFELIDRVLHHPLMPRLPLTLMLVAQVAVLVLPILTFRSWRSDRRGAKSGSRAFNTIILGGATIGVSLLAYLWVALMLAAMPD